MSQAPATGEEATTSATAEATGSATGDAQDTGGLPGAAIAGIVVGGVALLGAAGGVAVRAVRRRSVKE
jgi:hypothetical protein